MALFICDRRMTKRTVHLRSLSETLLQVPENIDKDVCFIPFPTG